MSRVGSMGREWVVLDKPKPARVVNIYDFWVRQPPAPSERLKYWQRQVQRGWLPNARIIGEGRDGCAQWFGVWMWEWQEVLWPMINRAIADLEGGE